MEAQFEKLYSELRTIQTELLTSIPTCTPAIKSIIEDELKDIEETIAKLETGDYGYCESSGQYIPESYLLMMPTIKTLEDVDTLGKFYCKPI